jgi:hypothetical protein
VRAVAAVVAAVLLAGCSADRPAPPPASPAAGPSSAVATPSSSSPTAAPPAVTVVAVPKGFSGGFRTPTGNVTCEMSEGYVRCDATVRPWKELPREKDCGGTAAWRTRLVLNDQLGASLRGECGYDPPAGGPALAYGTRLDLGNVRCLSERTGLTCWVAGTRRGFVVSRAAYRLTADPPAAAAAATPPPADPALVVAPRGFRGGFHTADYGVVCDIADDLAYCLVLGGTRWQPPPATERCEDGDPSTEVLLEKKAKGRALTGCRSDSLSGGDVLAVGHGVRVGDVRCDVTASAVECRNAATRHGFSVSREAFRGY